MAILDKKALLIINPVAGRKQIQRYVVQIVRSLMDKGYLVTTMVTAGRTDARDWTARFGADFDLVVCAGGGYMGVCSAVEGYPVAARFNDLGYDVFLLTYRVSEKKIMPKPVDDLAAALKFKGIVANLTELEAIENPSNGDVYQVTNPGTGKTNAEYVYDSTNSWIELGTVIDLSGYAPIASPTFTGTPTAPTPTSGDDSTKIATTAYVQDELDNYIPASDIAIITQAELAAMWAD
jgi:hypothetical protein